MGRGWRVGLLGILVSAVVIVYFVSQLDLALLGSALTSGRYTFLLPAFALLLLGLWTRALRWQALLLDDLPAGRAFHILNVSYLVNGVLPLRLGEVARAFLASRAQPSVTIPRALSTIVVERLLDLLSVIGLVALGASTSLPPELRAAALAGAPLALGGLIVLVLLAANQRFSLRLLDALLGALPALERFPIRHITQDIFAGVATLAKPVIFLRVVGWTIISWVLSVAAGWVLMFAFWETASWSASLLMIAAASLAIALPAVPGNVGTYEAAIVLALSPSAYGQPLETATAFAVIVHALNLLLYAIMGGIGLLREGVSLTTLRENVAASTTRG
jgi:uncharacterized protein (TIRG00374 family)